MPPPSVWRCANAKINMINLLPPAEKERLHSERKQKLSVVLCLVILAGLSSLCLILLSLKFYLLQEAAYYQNALQHASAQYAGAEFEDAKRMIKEYNALLARANAFYKNQWRAGSFLASAANLRRPDAVRFISLSIEKDASGTGAAVAITGTSDTREHLLEFKESLMANPQLKEVYFPPESWIKQRDVQFSLTFTMNLPSSENDNI